MSDDRPAIMAAPNVVKVGRIGNQRFVAYFKDQEWIVVMGPTPESAIGKLAKTLPDRFQRPSQEIGQAIMADPDAFGITIEIDEG